MFRLAYRSISNLQCTIPYIHICLCIVHNIAYICLSITNRKKNCLLLYFVSSPRPRHTEFAHAVFIRRVAVIVLLPLCLPSSRSLFFGVTCFMFIKPIPLRATFLGDPARSPCDDLDQRRNQWELWQSLTVLAHHGKVWHFDLMCYASPTVNLEINFEIGDAAGYSVIFTQSSYFTNSSAWKCNLTGAIECIIHAYRN